jgi:hypothetical protein
VGLQGVFVAAAPNSLKASSSPDYESFYRPVAENLREGQGFSLSGAPALRYPPGYPTALAGIYAFTDALGLERGTGVTAFSLACMGFAAVALFALTEKVFNIPIAALTTILWITYPLNLFIASSTGSEAFFMVVFYACVLVLFSGLVRGNPTLTTALATGALAGAASLIRPIGVFVGVALAVVLFVVCRSLVLRRRLLLGAAVIFANLLVIAPWLVWSSARAGDIVPLSTAGPASVLDGLTIGADPSEPRDVDLPMSAREVTERAWHERGALTSTAAIASFLLEQSGQRPVGVISLIGGKALHSFYASESRRLDTLLAFVQLPYVVLIGLGLMKARGAEGPVAIFLVVSVVLSLYFWAMTIAALSIVRYMTPVLGVLLAYAGRALWDHTFVQRRVMRQ